MIYYFFFLLPFYSPKRLSAWSVIRRRPRSWRGAMIEAVQEAEPQEAAGAAEVEEAVPLQIGRKNLCSLIIFV